jgi:hypothetical protein
LPIRGSLPDFSDRSRDREPVAHAVLIQKELAIDVLLYTFLQILSVHSFEKIPILQRFLTATTDSPPPHYLTN